MYSKYLLLIIIATLNSGCSEYKDRRLLYSCSGVEYTHLTKDSFLANQSKQKVQSTTSLFIGDSSTELSGLKFEICKNGHTSIVFGNCEKKDLVNYYSFDLMTHKLLSYDFYSEDFRKQNNFPLIGDSLRGEFECHLLENH